MRAARARPRGTPSLEYAKLTAPSTGANAEIGGGELGGSAAISADGTTAIAGAFDEASGEGAAYVFTRSGTTWTLQAKLTAPTSGASRAIGTNIEFGNEVALSADGNTAMIGGFGDNSDAGAAWVYTRGPSGWSVQQKLVAPTTGAGAEIAPGEFGSRVSLNAAGTTALIAGRRGPRLRRRGVDLYPRVDHRDDVDRAHQTHGAHHRRRSRGRRGRLRERRRWLSPTG